MTGILITVMASAQVGINEDGSPPDGSAMLDIKSTNRGFLPPRMTSGQMMAIPSPPTGLMVYNSTLSSICWFNGVSWESVVNRDGASCGEITYGNQTYHSVFIGFQCWMKENLNIGTGILGTEPQTNNQAIEKYCWNNHPPNCTEYGGLYWWDEMMNYESTPGAQGICPSGWHIPTVDEWNTLISYLGGASVAGGKLKETGTIHWISPNTGASNSSGFTALGGSFWYSPSSFINIGVCGFIWSSSLSVPNCANDIILSYEDDDAEIGDFQKTLGISVRCILN
jgi:uncharacterized protein (TIGR02145 family)